VTLGLMQGKFRVWTEPSTGARMVNSPFHGTAESAVRSPNSSALAHVSPSGAPLTLARLKARVQEVRR
jgi:hypothetical protein